MDINGNYNRPVKVADGIFWIGVYEPEANLHCNAYLLVEGEHALIIDGGSRPDFANIMMKILQAGVQPQKIAGLIYQHYDPDLCGSLSNYIDLCDNKDLKIYSKASNNMFLRYYFEKSHHAKLTDIGVSNYELDFYGRRLKFIKTPYTHAAGSFVTFDERTGTLFTSDLFGSFSQKWRLFEEFNDGCLTCNEYGNCPNHVDYCPLPDLISFHQHVMPCNKSLSYSMGLLEKLPVKIIAPQHGSVYNKKRDIAFLISLLKDLKEVGMDAIA